MKLRGVEIGETVGCLLYRSRLAELTWETLSVVCLILSSVWHVGRDIYQSGNWWIRSGFSNYGASITVSDKNARSTLLSEDAFCGSHIFFKGCLRLLDDANVVTILDENVVNTLPARTICPGAVDQNNVPHAMVFVLRGESAAAQQQERHAEGLGPSLYSSNAIHQITHLAIPVLRIDLHSRSCLA